MRRFKIFWRNYWMRWRCMKAKMETKQRLLRRCQGCRRLTGIACALLGTVTAAVHATCIQRGYADRSYAIHSGKVPTYPNCP